MKKVRRLGTIIVTILLLSFLTFNLYSFISIKICKKDMAPVFGYAILEVVSGSMEPTIKIGDLIIIHTNEKDYKKNDIVTFYDDRGNLVTHRIISLQDKVMVTKGDYNNIDDGKNSTDKIVGKYVFKLSGVGNFLKILKSPLVTIVILVTSFLYCVTISIDSPLKVSGSEDYEEFQMYLNNKKLEENSLECTSDINRSVVKKKKSNRKKKKKRAKRKRQSR